MSEIYDCIIIANGLFPSKEVFSGIISDNSCIIICDGAIDKAEKNNIVPDFIVGDLDSIGDESRIKYADKLIHFKEQDNNDLTKAVLFAKDKGFRNVAILGATGLREDHSLGNISLLTYYKEIFDSVTIISDYGKFISINKTTTIKSVPGQQISIFNLPPLNELSSEGLLYPIENRKLPIWWEGTLNQALSDSFTIYTDDGSNVIIYLSNFDK